MKKFYILIFLPLFHLHAQLGDSTLLKNDTLLKTKHIDEIVISASRIPESILASPVSIDLLNLKTLKNTPAPSSFDALEYMKGVNVVTPSLGFKVVNTRGFMNTTNVRFVTLTDGTDMQAPSIGASIANNSGPSELDIERMEIVHGTASALYGMNALNGMLNIITKSPFKYEGLSVYQRTGVNHVSDNNIKPQLFSESAIRYAETIKDRLGYKINFSYLKGYDWIANQQMDLNPTGNSSLGLYGSDNPAQDPVSSYGNESPNRKNLTLGGKSYQTARTGYYEKDITDYAMENLKGDVGLYYKITPTIEISYIYRGGLTNNVYQRTNRFKLDDYSVQQHILQLNNKNFSFKGYWTLENTGKSYNIRSLAENLDKTFKSDNQWYADFTSGFNNSVAAGNSTTESLHLARENADNGRYVPGTDKYNQVKHNLININNWDQGAALRVRSDIVHVEGQYDLTPHLNLKTVSLLVGADYRTYIVVPDGNYFINPQEPGHNLLYRKGGTFAQAGKTFLDDHLKITGTIRVDKNEYFDPVINPRASVVYDINKEHFIRASWQNGYRFPSLFEAFSNVNSGGVKRIGGLPIMSEGLNIYENSYYWTSVDAFNKAVTNDINKNGLTNDAAAVKNQELLKKSNYTYIKPEHVNAFEVGYKCLFLDSKLFVDVDFYCNIYQNFIAQVEVASPKTGIIGVDNTTASQMTSSTTRNRYRMWTNSKSTVYNYGSSLGLKYNLFQTFTWGGNVTYSALDHKTTSDGLEESFNTPMWMWNISLANPTIYKTFGFNVIYRWQSNYLWQSSLGSGNVSAYCSLDAQISYQLTSYPLTTD
jgi:outer membrane receptor protein involved in Fe transport